MVKVFLPRTLGNIGPGFDVLGLAISGMGNSCLITAAFAKDDYTSFARSLNDHVIEPVHAKLIPRFYWVEKNTIETGANGVAISGSGPTDFAMTNNLTKARLIKDTMIRAFCQFKGDSTVLIIRIDSTGIRLIP